MEYMRRGRPPWEVSHCESHRPSFYICRKARYTVPEFNCSNPNLFATALVKIIDPQRITEE